MKQILIIIALLSLCSCKTITQVQTEYIEVHDTIRDLQIETIHDSVILVDSIVVTQDEAGEVVYKEKYIYRDRWHDGETKVVHDSIIVYRDNTDSVTVEESKHSNITLYLLCASLVVIIVLILLLSIKNKCI